MTWKIKDLKELVNNRDDEDVVVFREYCRCKDALLETQIQIIETRKPKRTEFVCGECKNCFEFEVESTRRHYCKRANSIVDYVQESCEEFKHKTKDLIYLE